MSPVPAAPGHRIGDVLVVGDVMVDVVAAHDAAIQPGSDTAARIHVGDGGSAANTAAWLAAEGERPRLLAAIGDDDLGRRTARALGDDGIALVGPVVADATTGTCVVLVGPDGERTMLPDRGANDRLPVAAVALAFERRPGWLHVSGYALLHAGSRPAGQAALAVARAEGATVSVDAASAAPIGAVGAEAFLGWVAGIDLLLANDDEMAVLGGLAPVLEAAGAVVVKHGAAGATWTDGCETVRVDGMTVDVVDTTGAGDAFAAGWIAAARSRADVHGCLTRAVQAGATAVTRPGARPVP